MENKKKTEKEMFFDYDLSDHYFKYYDEAYGVNFGKKKLLKHPNAKIGSFLKEMTKILGLLFLLFLFIGIIGGEDCLEVSASFMSFIIVLEIFYILVIFIASNSKANSKKGRLIVNKNGIIDETDGLRIEVDYVNIDLVCVTKNLVVFICKAPFFIMVKNDQASEIVEALNKYSDVEIRNFLKEDVEED